METEKENSGAVTNVLKLLPLSLLVVILLLILVWATLKKFPNLDVPPEEVRYETQVRPEPVNDAVFPNDKG